MSYDGAPFHAGLVEWNDYRISELKRMWAEGFSCSQIAKALGGTTRNAVIGKAHRLGLEHRATPSRQLRVKIRTRPLPVQAVVPGSVGLTDLQYGSCRYPMGDPKEKGFGFCGCPRIEGSSYCPTHHAVTHSAQPDKRLAMLEREKEAA